MRKFAALAAFGALIVAPHLGTPTANTAAHVHRHRHARHARHVTIPTRPCLSDDGPAPCFWDAGERGNGRGYSFWLDRAGHVHYLDPHAPGARRPGREGRRHA